MFKLQRFVKITCGETGIIRFAYDRLREGFNPTKSLSLRAPLFYFSEKCERRLSLFLRNKKAAFRGFLHDWRRDWDSNPGYTFGVHTLSRRAPSTTRTPLHYIYDLGSQIYDFYQINLKS